MNRIIKRILFVFGIMVLLAACANQKSAPDTESQNPTETLVVVNGSSETVSKTVETANSGEELTSTEESTADEASSEIVATATPDIRLSPEDWKNWPVVPQVSDRAKAIYLAGIQSGNDPHSFSKVGDCQSIKEVLMGLYDMPGRYSFTSKDAYLLKTIEQFKGSFNRDGYAVKGGFNAATVLSPIWADPEVCLPGENPLACEIRVHNPSMVIISLEVWWKGRTPERYEQYMRKIIEYSIAEGVVPILSTKADNVEGDHSINYATAKLAYEYDIPLWNFWLAAQALPFQGIDPDRDGFHITVGAWNERSYSALKSVDAVWNSGNMIEEEPIQLQTEEPGNDGSESDLDYDRIDFSKQTDLTVEHAGQLIFELAGYNQGTILPIGIYNLNFNDGELSKIIESGYHLYDVQTSLVLFGNEKTMVISDLNGNKKIEIPLSLVAKAFWISEHEFVYSTVNGDTSLNVWRYDQVSQESYPLIPEGVVTEINKSQGNQFFFSGNISCIAINSCDGFETYHYDLDTAAITPWGYLAEVATHPNQDNYSFVLQRDGIDNLYVVKNSLNTALSQYIGLVGNYQLDQAWSPVTNDLAVIRMMRSDYFGKSTDLLHYVVNTDAMVVKEYLPFVGLNPHLVWSSDGKALLTTATQIVTAEDASETYKILIRLLNLSDGKIQNIDETIEIILNQYILVNQMYWSE